MRLWQVFIKSVREQKRDLWVIGLSLAFAPLFVFIYWLMTGGTGTTSYSVLVINQDAPVALADGARLAAGDEVVARLRGLAYESGSPLLKVTLVGRPRRSRAAAARPGRRGVGHHPRGLLRATGGLPLRRHERQRRPDLRRRPDQPDLHGGRGDGDDCRRRLCPGLHRRPAAGGTVEIPLGASAARTEFENYVPGLFVLAVVLMVFQAAMTPARDIESGALRRLRLTPLTAFDYLGGTSLWLGLVSIAAVVLTFATAVAFGFRSQGPLWLALVVTAITSLSIIGIGLLVACFSKTVSQAFVIANFPLGFLMFLTGAAFPLPRLTLFTLFGRGFALPDLLPPTHAVVALNKIFTLGSGLQDVAFELAALTLLSVLYFGLGVLLFQRTQMTPDRR